MILLDYKNRKPIYEQVVEKLKEIMICGGLEQDSQLPSVRSLAMELSINPNTIQRAYAELEREGYIYSVIGKGSFVADIKTIRGFREQELRGQLKKWMEEAAVSGVTKEKVLDWIREDMNHDTSYKSDETV